MKQKRTLPKRKRRRRRQDEEHHGTIAIQQPSSERDLTSLQNQIGNAAVQRLVAEKRKSSVATSGHNLLQAALDESVQREDETKKADSFSVLHSVPYVPQLTNMSCWAASAAMLISWRDSISIDDTVIAAGINYWRQYIDGLHPEDVHMFRQWGLTTEEPQTFTIQAFRNMIELYGPLWVAADANSAAGVAPHIRVISGIYGDGTVNGTYLVIQDPAGKQNHVESYATYVQAQEELAEEELPKHAKPIYVAHL